MKSPINPLERHIQPHQKSFEGVEKVSMIHMDAPLKRVAKLPPGYDDGTASIVTAGTVIYVAHKDHPVLRYANGVFEELVVQE